MIKVDLQHDISEEAVDFFEEKIDSNFNPKIIIESSFKIIFLFAFLLGLYIYEQKELNLLNAILQKKQNIETKIKNQIIKKKKTVKELSVKKSKYSNLKNKVFKVSKITKSRLGFIKTMDALLAFKSKKLWFKNVDYSKDILSIRGSSISKRVLDKFLKEIGNRKQIFKSYVLRESKSERLKGFNIRSFYLELRLNN
ncbi:MAG: hypothetical protein HAW60_00805 [Bdellovibrionales bacterium]|nr:hypothetical protein [Bdellovibrionales bacterium]